MAYQYKCAPLTQEEANRLANACDTHWEKLVVRTIRRSQRFRRETFAAQRSKGWQMN